MSEISLTQGQGQGQGQGRPDPRPTQAFFSESARERRRSFVASMVDRVEKKFFIRSTNLIKMQKYIALFLGKIGLTNFSLGRGSLWRGFAAL